MNASDQIISVLDKLGEQMGIAIDWTSENILPYIQDLVSRIAAIQIVNSIIGIVFATISLFLIIFIILKLVKKSKVNLKESGEYLNLDDGWFIGSIMAIVILGMLSIVLFSVAIPSLTQAIWLPEITAYEYIKMIAP